LTGAAPAPGIGPLPEAGYSLYCRNCSLFLGEKPGKYCPHCGQETAPHPPSLGEFIHEFVGHYIALEGPLVRTLGLLFFRPGELTREYLQGRKRRYVLPLRLYLSISLVFFLLVGSISAFDGSNVLVLGPESVAAVDIETLADLREAREEIKSVVAATRGGEAAKAAGPSLDKAADKVAERVKKAGELAKDAAQKSPKLGLDARNQLNKSPAFSWDKCTPAWLCARLKHRIDAWNAMPPDGFAEAMKTRALHAAPIAMFVLLPLYALLLKIVYFNRRMYFGEHLVFSFHLHSFMFLLLMAMMLPIEWLGSILSLWLLIYPVFALKRVYGGRWLPTLVRSMMVAFLYMLALVPALLIFSVVFIAA